MTKDDSLHVHDLHKSYPTPAEPLQVLRGVGFTLLPGEFAAIVGPSGSGKSTLLNILGTLDEPTSGDIHLAGTNPFELTRDALARFRSQKIGFVFQEHHLLPQCSAIENVLIARMAIGKVNKDHITRANQLLTQVGLNNRQSHRPAELSGGERQRVAVARALMNRPAMLLCDEPTGSLDATTGKAVADLIFEVATQSKLILIAVTHSAELAARFPRQLKMNDGLLREGA